MVVSCNDLAVPSDSENDEAGPAARDSAPGSIPGPVTIPLNLDAVPPTPGELEDHPNDPPDRGAPKERDLATAAHDRVRGESPMGCIGTESPTSSTGGADPDATRVDTSPRGDGVDTQPGRRCQRHFG